MKKSTLFTMLTTPLKRRIRLTIFSCCLILATLLLFAPLAIVYRGKQQIFSHLSTIPSYGTAIVFGAGIRSNGKPSDILADRLTIAANLYRQGAVETILISGDGIDTDVSETAAMKRYLEHDKSIPAQHILRDVEGTRTLETCSRAVQVWGIRRAILVSQGYHLHRAIFTCSFFGMDVAGVAANLQEYRAMSSFKFREVFAMYRMILDLGVLRPILFLLIESGNP